MKRGASSGQGSKVKNAGSNGLSPAYNELELEDSDSIEMTSRI